MVMMKHAETNGYLTIEEHIKEDKEGTLKAYLRSVKGDGVRD